MWSPFEIGMLLCFGVSWPFAVVKTWASKTSRGKSFVFLWLIFTGYALGSIHRAWWDPAPVVFLYVFNGLMVLADILLSYRYRRADAAVTAAGIETG